MKPTAPTPDMTKVHRAELSAAHAEINRLLREHTRDEKMMQKLEASTTKANKLASDAKERFERLMADAKAKRGLLKGSQSQWRKINLKSGKRIAALERRVAILRQRLGE